MAYTLGFAGDVAGKRETLPGRGNAQGFAIPSLGPI